MLLASGAVVSGTSFSVCSDESSRQFKSRPRRRGCLTFAFFARDSRPSFGGGDKNDSSPNYSQITSTAVQNEPKTTVPAAAAAAASRGLAPAARFQTVPVTPTGKKKDGLTQARVRPPVSIGLDLLCLHIRLPLKVAIGQANRI